MSLTSSLRGFRATSTIFVSAALALTPAVAEAAAKKSAPAKHAVTAASGLGNRVGLGAATQLAAINTAIKASPAFYAGRESNCSIVTPLLTSQPGQIMGGNFRDSGGNCYVWLNLQQSSMLTGSEICKVALHEMGHLNGLQHSDDPADIMSSPFRADPIPAPCAAPVTTVAEAKVKAAAAKTTCPPGATNQDYCAAVTPKKKAAKKSVAHRTV